MALKITKSDEVIEVTTICMAIYSQPGLGKTSLAFTASNPLLFDFDKGAHRALDRKDVVQVEKWSDVAGIKAADVADYDTIVLDTVGKALEVLAQDIIAGNSRLAYGGALNQQGWGQLGVRFSAFLRMIRGYGKDVILISHMDEKQDGDQTKERLKIQGGSKDVVLTDSDVIARISIFNKRRHLVFNPTETAFGKDPAGMEVMELPDASESEFATCLADIIAKTKAAMNELSADQIARKGEVEWFTSTLPSVMNADGINDLLGRAKKAGSDVAKMVVNRADELGLEFDGNQKKYVYLEEFEPTLEDDVEKGDEAA